MCLHAIYLTPIDGKPLWTLEDKFTHINLCKNSQALFSSSVCGCVRVLVALLKCVRTCVCVCIFEVVQLVHVLKSWTVSISCEFVYLPLTVAGYRCARSLGRMQKIHFIFVGIYNYNKLTAYLRHNHN